MSADPLTGAMPMAIELADVRRVVPQGPTTRTLFTGLHVSVRPGAWTTITGRSGSGKTALLELLGLLRPPDHGEVWLASVAVAWDRRAEVTRRRAREIGFVFQQPALDESASVVENVLDGWRLAGRRADGEVRDRLEGLATEVGLGALLDQRVDRLSGGEKQRVSILRAMLKQPSVVVADEPTASLDGASGRQVVDLLDRAAGHGAAIVVVTHDDALARHGDERFVLDHGVLTRLDSA